MARRSLTTEAVVTTDHRQIRRWASSRGAQPVRLLGATADVALTLPDERLDLPARPVGWREFFAEFEARRLAFLYQKRSADGSKSAFNQLVPRAAHAA